MTPNFSPQNPLQPLSLGNVVTAGFRLYSSHIKSYFMLALRAALWSLLPFLFFIVAGIILSLNSRSNNNLPLAWLIVGVIGLSFYFYTLGKSLANAATISRLAFGELINQPESVKSAYNLVEPRKWTFVLTVLLLFTLYFGILLLSAFFMIIPLLNIFILLLLILGILWLIARLFIVDALIAIEDNLTATSAINRSWDLSQGNIWRLVLILCVALLITIPLQLLVQLITRAIVQVALQPLIPEAINGSTNAALLIGIIYLLILLVTFFITSVILPFWQTVKAVIYYDLRSRREGFGLQLRDRDI